MVAPPEGPRRFALIQSSEIGEQEVLQPGYQFLHDCAIQYNPAGNILYIRYAPADFDRGRDVVVYPRDQRITPSADRSRYKNTRRAEVVRLPDVETGIRHVDHVLEAVQGKERAQVETVRARASDLIGAFMAEFNTISDEALKTYQRETQTIFEDQKIHPSRLRDWDKKWMVGRTTAASGMRDITERRNLWISIERLLSAFNRTFDRERALTATTIKFIKMGNELELERGTARTVCQNVAHYLDPDRGIPASVLFRSPSEGTRAYQSSVVANMFDTMISQLRGIHLNAYRAAAAKVIATLSQARDELLSGKVQRVGQSLIPQAFKLLTSTLQQYEFIRH